MRHDTTPGFYAHFTDDMLSRTAEHVDTMLSFSEVLGEPDPLLEGVYSAILNEMDFRDITKGES